MNKLLRWLFFAAFIRPFLTIIMGLNVRNRSRLPESGPAILVANHNSHLDTPVIISLFPHSLLPHLRPVAAQDYFFSTRFLKWFSTQIMGIIPIARIRSKESTGTDPLAPISAALKNNDIVIFFPEGTRGRPEQMADFKSGIAILAQRHPEIPIVPIFLHGLGKALPRGEALLVPFFLDVFVGEHLKWTGDKAEFLTALNERFTALAEEGHIPDWT
ncbi:MAG TPA: 1-acyl-sn-glycerol-3-phosphate acyltransferase [Bdellovibrionales bacterium]|nr:MAG: glycerol acyltransferase [Bdellovibrionales bacterium GWB1_52_6]OFZ05186.1 MAG: glycerol acyltransferase [Bdellovibrionales bacterium GWA1_52_35]OFZ39265.1 MAG: glycerol acyltransferase [Bdellovibrionales bacterium GWC1_52_8]HAR41674.1 1-acyl-sn-glycerol-3-phosphate acyltransferase [Bdellovibrionales bacterium]HCM38684.1 1-acyl-sn-glycerol-3-phosphate acyltransferase [Bdellovibrionales bacterium]